MSGSFAGVHYNRRKAVQDCARCGEARREYHFGQGRNSGWAGKEFCRKYADDETVFKPDPDILFKKN